MENLVSNIFCPLFSPKIDIFEDISENANFGVYKHEDILLITRKKRQKTKKNC